MASGSSMESQVAEAALAVVHPTTDADTRSAASQFLEQWTVTPQAWQIYANWLRSFSSTNDNDNDNDTTLLGTRLLCLTMLLNKIRRENLVVVGTHDAVSTVRNELWSLLQNNALPTQLLLPLCTCTAALAVRGNATTQLIEACSNNHSLVLPTSLKLLSVIPQELSVDLSSEAQVANELFPHVNLVLSMVQRALLHCASTPNPNDIALPALETLCRWADASHVSLTHLNTAQGGAALLPILIEVLSQRQVDANNESLIAMASQALTASILVPSDSCTPTRQEAVMVMANSISQHGFLAAPLASSNSGDTTHALATTLCTLVSEEVDDLSSQPAPPGLLDTLFYIQSHPQTNVAMAAMECWLTLQDVSTSDRHEDWKRPLFTKVLDVLIQRLAYPSNFTTWENEFDLDQDEFQELRTSVADIYMSCYFLLRASLLHQVTASFLDNHNNNTWQRMESGLDCLSKVSQEVCDRCKSTREYCKADRQATVQQLLHICNILQSAPQHPVLLSAAVRFLGRYAPVWNAHCTPEDILGMLTMMTNAIRVPEATEAAAIAIRAVHVGCRDKLLACFADANLQNRFLAGLTLSLKEILLAAPSSSQKSIQSVAEGITRTIVHIPDQNAMVQMLGHVVEPMIQQAQQALPAMATAQVEVACEQVVRNLCALQTIVKFCEVPNGGTAVHPLTDNKLHMLLTLFQNICEACHNEHVMKEALGLQSQLLKTIPTLVQPHFFQILELVVKVFDKSKHPDALAYVACALEAYSPLDQDSTESFSKVLGHTTSAVVGPLESGRPYESPLLLEAFFEMSDRFLLFCPSALIHCKDFSMVIALAMECLSSRASLIFLAHLFGWRGLRLTPDATAALEAGSRTIDEKHAQYGEDLVAACVSGLLGGPQMLWPSLSDCLLAVLAYFPDKAVAQKLVYTAMASTAQTDGTKSPTPEDCQQIVKTLFDLVGGGKKSKPKATMLLADFAKMQGNLNSDSLLSYLL